MKYWVLLVFIFVVACAPKSSDDEVGKGSTLDVPTFDNGNDAGKVSPEHKESLTVEVDRVIDGDTFWGTDTSGATLKVRLFVIDAPERSQDFGKDSGKYLRELIGQRQVEVKVLDYHGDRKVAQIFLDGEDVGLKMVQSGWAWHYRYFSDRQEVEQRNMYLAAEENARKQQLGLWSGKSPEPPWVFRRRN